MYWAHMSDEKKIGMIVCISEKEARVVFQFYFTLEMQFFYPG